MDNKTMQRLDQILARQTENVLSEKRFKIDKFSQEDVVQMLQMCYKAEIDQRCEKFTADEATLEKISKAAKWLTGDTKPGLLLYGSIGSGKTTLARAMSNLINIVYGSNDCRTRKRVCLISARELAARVLDDTSILDRLKREELLFMDDLGVEPAVVKSWGNEISPVTELLYARYDSQRFTIATSNLADEEFKERYGERISDRMNEMFDRLYYSHKSYRK